MLLEDSGNRSKKQVDTYRLAQSLHKFIFQEGFSLGKDAEEYVRNYLDVLARVMQSLGNHASEAVKAAYRLIADSLKKNEEQVTQQRPRGRQKPSGQVAVAA